MHSRRSSLSAFVSSPTGCGLSSNRLQLNSDKTEGLWCTTGRWQHQLPTTALSIDGVQVSPVTSVRNLGIFIDSDLVMRSHVQRTVSRCFVLLRQLRQIGKSVPPARFQSLVIALVLSRLYYGNSVLVSLPITWYVVSSRCRTQPHG